MTNSNLPSSIRSESNSLRNSAEIDAKGLPPLDSVDELSIEDLRKIQAATLPDIARIQRQGGFTHKESLFGDSAWD